MIRAAIVADPVASDCKVNTPGLVLVIAAEYPDGFIIEVGPTVKVPVLAILVPWPLKVIVHAEPDVPAVKVPVLVIGVGFALPRVITDAESALNVPALLRLIELLPELYVIVVPLP